MINNISDIGYDIYFSRIFLFKERCLKMVPICFCCQCPCLGLASASRCKLALFYSGPAFYCGPADCVISLVHSHIITACQNVSQPGRNSGSQHKYSTIYYKLYDPSNNDVYVCIAKCLNGLKLHIENKPVNSLIWYTIVLISRHLLITPL